MSHTLSSAPPRLETEYHACVRDLDALERRWSSCDRSDPAAFADAAVLGRAIAAKRAERDALARLLERQRETAEIVARLSTVLADLEQQRRSLLDRLLAVADVPSEADFARVRAFDRDVDLLRLQLARAQGQPAPRLLDGTADICRAYAQRVQLAERRALVVHRFPKPPASELPAWQADVSRLAALLAGGAHTSE
jgi:hypothetical protein